MNLCFDLKGSTALTLAGNHKKQSWTFSTLWNLLECRGVSWQGRYSDVVKVVNKEWNFALFP